jgi:3'(2'), 5'-bisphosphate nucleotidase
VTDAELCSHLASEAGKLLFELQRTGKFEGKALGQEGDRIANAYLCASLASERPDDAVLSEEEIDCSSRCASNRVWIVDPLDGTREYSEGRSDWAVHVALAVGGVATHGAVALPGLGNTLSSRNPPALKPANQPLKMLVSRTRPAAEALAVAEILGAELLPMGSAGAKAMAVVTGEADIYLHTGGQYEWDNCAPVAVAAAAGLHCSRIDGSPMRYNNANPYLPDLLICRKELVDEVWQALKSSR